MIVTRKSSVSWPREMPNFEFICVLFADKKQSDKYAQLIEQQRHNEQIVNGDVQVNGKRPAKTDVREKTTAKR